MIDFIMNVNNMPAFSTRWSRTLADARKGRPSNGHIWRCLREAVPEAEETLLIEWLQDIHGVSVLAIPLPDELISSQQPESFSARLVDIAHACAVTGTTRQLICEDPWSPAVTLALSQSSNKAWNLVLARADQLKTLSARFVTPTTHVIENSRPALQAEEVDASAVDFVNTAIQRAYSEGASDIHFETDRNGVSLKYRLDGVMAPGARLKEKSKAEEVISRIKVLAQLDITERRRPQDGRIHWSIENNSVDLRVSIMPSIFGEDAVLRLLDKAQLRKGELAVSLNTLGFSAERADKLRNLATRPHGMLLMTGPTGSGKTTTVYAALSEVNDGLEKIITIEDPVEYELAGVLQIPVNEQKGLTFATGLRSILRHDPDKILVGEIRDAETAEIAVQSSLTGHLVFTTVHANSLFDVLARFQHFGIEPFALASALNGIVVQRLLRRICPHCVQWRNPREEEAQKLMALDIAVPTRLPVSVGCEYCRETGYKGRFVVAEIHEITDLMRDLMVRNASMSELKKEAYTDNSQSLLSQAVEHAEAGSTSMEEIIRVVGLY